jgi:hypothetical protein
MAALRTSQVCGFCSSGVASNKFANACRQDIVKCLDRTNDLFGGEFNPFHRRSGAISGFVAAEVAHSAPLADCAVSAANGVLFVDEQLR